MGQVFGREGVLKISALTVVQFRSYGLSRESATTDGSVIGDEWDVNKATTKKWGMNAATWWDPADPGLNALTIGSTVTVDLYPQGIGSSAKFYRGAGIVTGLNLDGERTGLVGDALTMLGTGPLSTLTV